MQSIAIARARVPLAARAIATMFVTALIAASLTACRKLDKGLDG